jgi:serine phosphatase RsbU (regulator of sigma subunit)
MLHQAHEQRFITIVYALLEVRDDEVHARIACAGHPPAIVVPPVGDPIVVAASGDLLGVWPDPRLNEVELTVGPGGSLVFYTDGVTDQGPGLERSPVRAIRKLTGARSAAALADALRSEDGKWAETPRDDVAIVALRYLPAESAVGGGAGLTVASATA